MCPAFGTSVPLHALRRAHEPHFGIRTRRRRWRRRAPVLDRCGRPCHRRRSRCRRALTPDRASPWGPESRRYVLGPDPWPTTTSISRAPTRIHVVGVGGAGHERDRPRAARAGPHVSGCDAASRRLSALEPRGVDRPRRPRRRARRRRLDVVAVSTRDPGRQPRGRRRPRSAASRCSRAPRCWRAIVRRPRTTIAVAGTHGKTTTTSMLALILREAGLRAVVHHRRRRQRGRHRRGAGTTASGSWSRPTRATAPSSSSRADGAVVTNVEPDHLDHYGDFAALVDAFDRFLAEAPGPRSCAPTTRWPRPLGRGRAAHVTYGTADDADYRIVDVRAGRDGVGSASTATARRSATIDAAGARPAQRPQRRRRRWRSALELGVPFEAAVAGRWPASAAWPAASSSAASADGVTFVDDYAHLPSEVARRARAARGTAGGSRVVAVFQPHRYTPHGRAVAGLRRRVRRRRPRRLTDIYPAGEEPHPGRHRQARASTPCSTPTRGSGSRSSRRGPTSWRYLRRRAAPRRPVPDARRRRPHDRCPTRCSALAP